MKFAGPLTSAIAGRHCTVLAVHMSVSSQCRLNRLLCIARLACALTITASGCSEPKCSAEFLVTWRGAA